MIGLAGVTVFYYLPPCDMRKQMDGLGILVRESMQRNPEDGELSSLSQPQQEPNQDPFLRSWRLLLTSEALE